MLPVNLCLDHSVRKGPLQIHLSAFAWDKENGTDGEKRSKLESFKEGKPSAKALELNCRVYSRRQTEKEICSLMILYPRSQTGKDTSFFYVVSRSATYVHCNECKLWKPNIGLSNVQNLIIICNSKSEIFS